MSSDPPAANAAFRTKYAFPYTLLSDTDLSVSRAYGAAAAARASRVSVLVGPDGRVVRSYAAVRPAEHAAEVLADLVAARGD